MERSTQCVVLVLMEMGLSFLGIVCNLLVVTTLRQQETLRGTTLNFLLLNLCFSNLIISFLVKPISAIYVGYSVSTGEWQVGLVFCTLYTFTYRTTWCIFPFTLVVMFWCKQISQLSSSKLVHLCLNRKKSNNSNAINIEMNVERPTINRPEISSSKLLSPMPQKSSLLMRPSTGSVASTLRSPSPLRITASAPITEYAIHFKGVTLNSGNSANKSSSVDSTSDRLGLPRQSSSVSTVDVNREPPINVQESLTGFGEEEMEGQKRVRTLGDGPNFKQKVIVAFIWLGSAFFGVTTCFPDKVFGVEISQKILEDQLRTMQPPISVKMSLRDVKELTYCTVRTGINDLLDYIAVVVALVLPVILGPVCVALVQLVTALAEFFLGSRAAKEETELNDLPKTNGKDDNNAKDENVIKTSKEEEQEEKERNECLTSDSPTDDMGPPSSWRLLMAFTLIFLLTYPVHMYVAEMHLAGSNFVFLLVKYCCGFLFVILVPIVTLLLKKDIRECAISLYDNNNRANKNDNEEDNEDNDENDDN